MKLSDVIKLKELIKGEKMNPKISIIIPVYNAEKYLNRCFDSILSNNYKNLDSNTELLNMTTTSHISQTKS